jgi:hypothetical protein
MGTTVAQPGPMWGQGSSLTCAGDNRNQTLAYVGTRARLGLRGFNDLASACAGTTGTRPRSVRGTSARPGLRCGQVHSLGLRGDGAGLRPAWGQQGPGLSRVRAGALAWRGRV